MIRKSSAGHWVGMTLVCLLAVMLGMLISVSAGTAARVGLLLALAMVLLTAWAMPDLKTTAKPITWVFVASAFVTLLWPRFVVFKAGGMPALSPEKFMFIALLAVWAWVVMTSAGVRSGLLQRMRPLAPVLSALGLLVGWRIVTAFAGEPSDYYPGLKTAVTEMLAFYLMFVVGLTVWQRPADVRPYIWTVVLCGLVITLMGAYEAKISRNLFSAYASLDEDTTGRLAEALRDKFRSGKYRVQVAFDHPLVLAEFLVMAVPCALYLLVTSRKLVVKTGMALAILLFCALAYKTDSRAALAMIVIVLVFASMLFAYRSFLVTKSILGIIIGLLVPAILMALPLLVTLILGVVGGGGSLGDASTSARVYMLQHGIPLVFDNPIFGFGVGQGGVKAGVAMSGGLYTIDNHFLSLALDSGLPALLAYVFVMVWFGWRLFKLIANPSTEDAPLAICLLLALVGFCGMRGILSITNNTWLLFALMGAIGTLIPQQAVPVWRRVVAR